VRLIHPVQHFINLKKDRPMTHEEYQPAKLEFILILTLPFVAVLIGILFGIWAYNIDVGGY
jgi:hypothetical protein